MKNNFEIIEITKTFFIKSVHMEKTEQDSF